MSRTTVLLATACCAATLGLAAPAHAQGQVERGPDHARSICSFSGLNDEPDAAFPEGGRVQSYGQLVSQKVLAPSEGGVERPGFLCNPNNLPLK